MIQETEAEGGGVEVSSMDVQLPDAVVDVVTETDILSGRSAAFIPVRWDVRSEGPEGAEAIPDYCLTGACLFDHLHADVIVFWALFP